MTTSAAGLAALALFVLVLGYWVPLRVRQRQELADSRTDDRFSAGLRVLAVAARGRVPAVATAGESVDASGLILGAGDGHRELEGHHSGSRRPSPARAAVADLPVGGVMMSTASSGSRPTGERPTAERPAGERPTGERPTGRTARGGPARPQAADRAGAVNRSEAAAHRDQLAVRAQRASRRLRVTLLLVAAVAGVGAAAVAGVLPGWAVLAPTAPLVVVLVLGRIAANAARRADARWAAAQRAAERRALQARALAAGGPPAPRNRARVTGRAVRGSSTTTQALRRVEAHEVAGTGSLRPTTADARQQAVARAEVERADGRPAGQNAVTSAGPTGQPVAAEAVALDGASPEPGTRQSGTGPAGSRQAGSRQAGVPRAGVPQAAAGSGAPASDTPSAEGGAVASRPAAPTPSGTPWEARPVPLPTYVTKPAAPRREPRPLTGATPVVSTGWTSSTGQRLDDPGEAVGEANTSWSLGAPATETPAAPAEEIDDALRTPEPRPVTETLGLPLEQILARRRAAG